MKFLYEYLEFFGSCSKDRFEFLIFFELTWSKAGRTQSGFGPHLARGPPVGPAWLTGLASFHKRSILKGVQKRKSSYVFY